MVVPPEPPPALPPALPLPARQLARIIALLQRIPEIPHLLMNPDLRRVIPANRQRLQLAEKVFLGPLRRRFVPSHASEHVDPRGHGALQEIDAVRVSTSIRAGT